MSTFWYIFIVVIVAIVSFTVGFVSSGLLSSNKCQDCKRKFYLDKIMEEIE